MEIFKCGDTVKLKSGGPVMTVFRYTTERVVVCKWFAGAKSESDTFEVDMLENADPPKLKT